MTAILLEADEIVVKPFELGRFTDLIQERLLNRKPVERLAKERVSAILQRCVGDIVVAWLTRAKESRELNHLALSHEERTGHLPRLMDDLVGRLRRSSATLKDSDAIFSAAVVHGKLRYEQGYSPAMLVHESRILQVAIFGTLKDNLTPLDFSLLLPDVMTIADEVDAQLTQSLESFMKRATPMAA